MGSAHRQCNPAVIRTADPRMRSARINTFALPDLVISPNFAVVRPAELVRPNHRLYLYRPGVEMYVELFRTSVSVRQILFGGVGSTRQS